MPGFSSLPPLLDGVDGLLLATVEAVVVDLVLVVLATEFGDGLVFGGVTLVPSLVGEVDFRISLKRVGECWQNLSSELLEKPTRQSLHDEKKALPL